MEFLLRCFRYCFLAVLFAALGIACNLPVQAVVMPAATVLPASGGVAASTDALPTEPASLHTPIAAAPTSTSTPTPTPAPTPTQAPRLLQLTTGGCCLSPFWNSDSTAVLFIDKPSSEAPAGIWAVGMDGGNPALVTERMGIISPDMQILAYPEGDQTYVERLSTGEKWQIPSKGRSISFSPDGAWVAWTGGSSGPPFDTARREVWISRIDGTEARLVREVTGGGFDGWTPDSRMVITGQENGTTVVWLTKEGNGELEKLCDGSIFEMVRAERLRGVSLSPGGSWLAYQVTFSSVPEDNGLWVINTSTLERRKLPVFGAFRWRDDDSLLVVPLELGQDWHRLVQVEASTGDAIDLAVPGAANFKIANGEWSVSPDGTKVAFISAFDKNIWVLLLP